ncbi:TetR family transcriptional regulator [Streptosporangium sp. NPDC002721]|uniref:TetR/AcrR family transcriptional regulator n=1 Tax=Streptosporangium sp. NPDC002721 TaxID=3366188 RepID=UPI00368C6EAD
MSSADASAHLDRPRRGRRPGSNATRQAVLAAARARFARDGYTGTTIREIAADAGVDASLVMQFFRSKDQLFAAVMSITPAALARFAGAFSGPEDRIGERVTRAFLQIWDGDSSDSEPLLAMLRGAITNEQAASQLSEFIQARLLTEVRPDLHDDPATRIRVGLASSMLVGVIVGRRLVRVPTLVDVDPEALVELITPAVQAVLAGAPKTASPAEESLPPA